MFTDPQTITVDAVAQEMPRIASDGTSSLYSTPTENFKMRISHQESKGRTRHMVRIDQRVVAADPLTAVNAYQALGVYLVIDEPEYGFVDDAIVDVVTALVAWLSATTYEATYRIVGGES